MNITRVDSTAKRLDSKDTNFEQADYQRKLRILEIYCKILIGFDLFFFVFSFIVTNLIFSQQLPFYDSFFQAGLLGGALGSYYLARQGRLKAGAWLLIGAEFIFVTYIDCSMGMMTALMTTYMLVIVLAMALLDVQAVFWLTIGGVLVCAFINLGQNFFKFFVPLGFEPAEARPTIMLLGDVVVSPLILVLVILPNISHTRLLREQNKSLLKALADLKSWQGTSQDTGQEVLAVASQLRSTASQQNSGSQEQVANITQINTSVSELSQTARSIADLSGQVTDLVSRTTQNGQEIETTAGQVVDYGEKCLKGGAENLENVEIAATLYKDMMAIMLELKQKNANMRVILDLLGDIAGTTHLLALNAAIEAAGAGEYGERFGVVAQEVKALAQRSSAASQEVVGIIQEIEGTTQKAVEAAEIGFERVKEIGAQTSMNAKLVQDMQECSRQSQEQVVLISDSVDEVKLLTESIRITTEQQFNASQQVLVALNELGVVARHHTEGSHLLLQTAVSLEHLSGDLNRTLA